jgi:glycosyltransferase involved in cell wall biosynthesis
MYPKLQIPEDRLMMFSLAARARNHGRKVLMFVANAGVGDSRVIKTAHALRRLGYRVTLVAVDPEGRAGRQEFKTLWLHRIPHPRWRLEEAGQWTDGDGINWAAYMSALVDSLAEVIAAEAPDILHTHDMIGLKVGGDTLSGCKERARPRWVHDVHEYVGGLTDIPEAQRAFFLAAEEAFVRLPDAVTTVSPAIASILRQQYALDVEPQVVLNAPWRIDYDPSRELDVRADLALPAGVPLMVYSGSAKYMRGVDLIVEAMPQLLNYHLAIITNKDNKYVRSIKDRVVELGLVGRVHLLPYVDSSLVTSYLRTADVGVHPIRRYPNAEVALPNKLFEYIHAGLAVAVSDNRLMKEFVERHSVGAVFRSEDTEALAEAVRQATLMRNEPGFHERLESLSEEFCWEKQARIIEDVYGSLPLGARTGGGKEVEEIRVAHLPIAQAGQPWTFASGLRRNGVASEAIAVKEHKFGYRVDRFMPLNANDANDAARLISQVAGEFNVLHYHALPVFFNLSFDARCGFDLLVAKLKGAKVFYHWRGTEIRMPSLFKEHSAYHYVDENPGLVFDKFNDKRRRSYRDYVQSICDGVFVADAELLTYVPDALVVPRVIDLNEWDVSTRIRDGRVRIVHAPSRRGVKGTEAVLKAVEVLKEKGLPIDFFLVEGMTHAEAREAYASADIIVDQLRIGWYGVLAVEGMALGKPVVTFIRDDLRPFLGDTAPVAIANPRNIGQVLERLVSDEEWRNDVGRQGRAYVEKVHDVDRVVKELAEIYREWRSDIEPLALAQHCFPKPAKPPKSKGSIVGGEGGWVVARRVQLSQLLENGRLVLAYRREYGLARTLKKILERMRTARA